MPEPQQPGDRSPAQREADHASLSRLSETLVPALVPKLNACGLGELEVREGDWRVRLRRPSTATAAPAARRPERPRLAAHPPEREARSGREGPATGPVPGDPPRSGPAEPDDRRRLATSPAVGVFRPGSAIGTRVRVGDRIGIVDLLGIPQDVLAPIDGTLVDVFIQAGEAVEYGEDIAAVEAEPEARATGDVTDGGA
jgi:acetyl-CoA carboxylase biotin carboxyl carrier protein